MAMAALATTALCLGGCTPKAPNTAAGTPIPGGVPLTPEHTLSPGDQFEVRFPFSPEFNDRTTIGQDGRVSLKLVGEALLGGLTVEEATSRLKSQYAKQLKAPELSVTIRRYAPEVIYIDGWVNRTGIVRSEIPLTLSRALAQAGGVKTGAKTDEILIMRRDASGRTQAVAAGLGRYAGAGRPDQDPMLKSFDVVYVPQTAIASVASFVQEYTKNIPFAVSFGVGTPAPPAQTVIPQTNLGRPLPPSPSVTPQ
jgi:protein involved in polysaccharide export with SLBB domain